MLDWIISAHPYLAYFAGLVLWCGIGYLEGRFISRGFACVTWASAALASAWAVVEKSGLGPLGWGLAAAILLGGAAWITYYYNFDVGRSNAKS